MLVLIAVCFTALSIQGREVEAAVQEFLRAGSTSNLTMNLRGDISVPPKHLKRNALFTMNPVRLPTDLAENH